MKREVYSCDKCSIEITGNGSELVYWDRERVELSYMGIVYSIKAKYNEGGADADLCRRCSIHALECLVKIAYKVK